MSSQPPVTTSFTTKALLMVVRIYQAVLSPLFGGHCRFYPSCSDYALEAIHTHGSWRGVWLIVKRILRCHPFGGHGYDPVPRSPSPLGSVPQAKSVES